jgi:hypothetical protein
VFRAQCHGASGSISFVTRASCKGFYEHSLWFLPSRQPDRASPTFLRQTLTSSAISLSFPRRPVAFSSSLSVPSAFASPVVWPFCQHYTWQRSTNKVNELSDDVVAVLRTTEPPTGGRQALRKPRQMAGRGFHVSVLSYCRFFTVEAVFRRGYGLRVKIGAMVPDGYNGTELKDPSLTAGPSWQKPRGSSDRLRPRILCPLSRIDKLAPRGQLSNR